MQISEVQPLQKALEKKPDLPVVLVAGGDDAIREAVGRLLVDSLSRSHSPVQLLHWDASNKKDDVWAQLHSEIINVPLFGDGRVIAIRNCDVTKSPPALTDFLSSPPPHLRLALFAGRKTQSSGLGKAVAAVGEVLVIADLRDAQAIRLARSLARDVSLTLSEDVARVLIDLVGPDRAAIIQSLQTLSTFHKGGGVIGEADLVALVNRSRKAPPWELDDAISSRNLTLALKIVGRQLEDSPQNLLGIWFSLNRRVHQIMLTQQLIMEKVPPADAMKQLGIRFDFQWRLLRENARRYSAAELKAFLANAPAWEIRLKRGPASPKTLMTAVLVALMGRVSGS